MNTLIMLCTYNEVDNLRELIPELLSLLSTANILVIDDNSPDGTGALVAEMAKCDDRIRLLSRPGKQGLGTATLEGFRYAIQHNYDLLINMDADFSHGPKYVPQLIAAAADYDVVIASRYVAGGGVAEWTFRRKLMSQTINFWARFWLGLTTADNSGSFRCFRVSRLAEVDWALTVARGYAFQEEILYRCHQVGCRMTEIPFIFEDRRFGVTKINLKECLVAVWVIAQLGFQRLLKRRVRRLESRAD